MSMIIGVAVALLISVLMMAVSVTYGNFSSPIPWQNPGQFVETTSEPAARVTGTVTYRERIVLSPDAALIVSLEDVSLLDAPSVNIAGSIINNPGQVPIYFSRYIIRRSSSERGVPTPSRRS